MESASFAACTGGGMSFILMSAGSSACDPLSWLPHRFTILPYHAITGFDEAMMGYDALIVDCTDHLGIEVCRRASHLIDPTIMPVFAAGPHSEDLELMAAGAGAVGYLIEPISPRQVIAKVLQHKNITRRSDFEIARNGVTIIPPANGNGSDTPIIRLCEGQHLVVINHASVHVTPMQLRILRLFLESEGSIITRDEFHRALWPDGIRTDSALNKHISKVARMLRQYHPGDTIQNLRGVGYKFVGNGAVEKASRPGSVF